MCVCVCEHLRTYFGVEALGILGYSVELREAEHVLLAARPVKYPQSEWRQSGKYLQHTEVTHAQPLKRLMTNTVPAHILYLYQTMSIKTASPLHTTPAL